MLSSGPAADNEVNSSTLAFSEKANDYQSKNISLKEGDWQKIQNQYLQKIQLLEMQNREMQEREENLRRLNDQIMSAFKDIEANKEQIGNIKSKFNKEFEVVQVQHSKEVSEYRQKLKDKEETYEQQIQRLTEKVKDLERENQSLRLQMEATSMEYMKNINHMQIQNETLNCMLKNSDEERKKIENSIKIEWQTRFDELIFQNEKLKKENEKHIRDTQIETEHNIESMKIIQQHEIHLLQTKINGLLNEQKVFSRSNEQNLQLYEELKQRYLDEANIYFNQSIYLTSKLIYKQRDSLIKEQDILRNKLNQAEQTIFQQEAKIAYYQNIQDKHDSIIKQKEDIFEEEKKKFKEKLVEYQMQIRKWEQQERNYQIVCREKDKMYEDLKSEMRKKVYDEKRKCEQMQQAANKIKDDYTKRNAFVIQEILNKEEQIKKLNSQVIKQTCKLNQSKVLQNACKTPSCNIAIQQGNNQNTAFNSQTQPLSFDQAFETNNQSRNSIAQLQHNFNLSTLFNTDSDPSSQGASAVINNNFNCNNLNSTIPFDMMSIHTSPRQQVSKMSQYNSTQNTNMVALTTATLTSTNNSSMAINSPSKVVLTANNNLLNNSSEKQTIIEPLKIVTQGEEMSSQVSLIVRPKTLTHSRYSEKNIKDALKSNRQKQNKTPDKISSTRIPSISISVNALQCVPIDANSRTEKNSRRSTTPNKVLSEQKRIKKKNDSISSPIHDMKTSTAQQTSKDTLSSNKENQIQLMKLGKASQSRASSLYQEKQQQQQPSSQQQPIQMQIQVQKPKITLQYVKNSENQFFLQQK